MELIYFLIRYTPFWAIPIFFICLEYGVRFKVKGKRGIARAILMVGLICMLLNLYYFWAGGPERSVAHLSQFLRDL